ncbi:hypothetical protein [Streptomyces oceani]|uniref:Uncharacterized protein n=1 Tax=Streptomyces oceani TaxID=1075402 RepID=A0A1E7KN94_9ACTN|nr:hypothetical protein [Streptomyces oceani]OEV05373.1 hypothetical protein AN216_03505 [Streptomyces oceani]
MLDTSPLSLRVDRLADRLRAAPQSALRRGAAASGLALSRELARRAQLREFPERVPYELPDAGPFAVGDQLAVAGHDLANALSGTEDEEALADAVRLVDAELTPAGFRADRS